MGETREMDFYRYLSAWGHFGAFIANAPEDGMVFTDLHEGNIIFSSRGPVIVDFGGTLRVKYPDEWRSVATGLMSLLSWLEMDAAAAFRMGYLQHSGPVGELIFDWIRTEFKYNAFRKLEDLRYNPSFSTDLDDLDIVREMHSSWINLRNRTKWGDMSRRTFNVGDFTLFEKYADQLGGPIIYLSAYYNIMKYVFSALDFGHPRHIQRSLRILLNYYKNGNYFSKFFAATRYFNCICSGIPPETIPDFWASEVNTRDVPYSIKQKYSPVPDSRNLFLWLWRADDLDNGNLALDSRYQDEMYFDE